MKTKTKVNWTIDTEVVEAVKRKAIDLTRRNKMKVSESAAANVLLQQGIEAQPSEPRTVRAAPKPTKQEPRYEKVESDE